MASYSEQIARVPVRSVHHPGQDPVVRLSDVWNHVGSSLALLISLHNCVRLDFVVLPYCVDRYLAAYMKSGQTVVARTWIFDTKLLNVV